MFSTTESQNAEVAVPTVASETSVENITPEFTRAAVDALGNRVRVTDHDEASGLELLCYVHCGPNDNNIMQQCRGVVFNKETIVMRSFPYTVEHIHTDQAAIEADIQPVFQNCSFYDSYEGALVRMFYFDGRWYTSTHRKLNAFHSKWASRESFGTSFKKALEAEVEHNSDLRKALPNGDDGLFERFQKLLDTKKQYMFLVRHNEENRIVCATPKRPTLYHVGTFVDGDLVMTENIHLPYPKKHTFQNISDLVNYVSKIDIRDLQGVIVFAPDNKQYKIIHKEYIDLFRARGNEPSIKFRYLQVRMDPRMVNMLYHLYPSMKDTFTEYENSLYAVAKTIYNSYVQRHIKAKWSTLPTEEYKVDCACHAWHEADRKNNRVTLDKVIEILNEQTPTALNQMIRRYHMESTQQADIQTRTTNLHRSNTITSPNGPAINNTPGTSPALLPANHQAPPAQNIGPAAQQSRPRTRILSRQNART